MYLLGLDIGSSFIKASLLEGHTGKCIAFSSSPAYEMKISSPKEGFAEQNPDTWLKNVFCAVNHLKKQNSKELARVKAIGISYQMHGLVAIDKAGKPIRDSIIWCDSRAIDIGNKAFMEMKPDYCLKHLLNSPGNFTASKLAWIKQNEASNYAKIKKILLPGDYIAYMLTGELFTTKSGLSEGILWDFENNSPAKTVMDYYGFDEHLLPDIIPPFSVQGIIRADLAANLGINKNAIVSYRAGDQLNNAFSLGVLQPGEAAVTAGTSGVVYFVGDKKVYDPQTRINGFLHLNHLPSQPRIGSLLCINGAGIFNSWMRQHILPPKISYEKMNEMASEIPVGSNGLMVFPFGNGKERMLNNKNTGAHLTGLDLNRHSNQHLLRAAQEGIAFAMIYGLEIMQEIGLKPSVFRAGNANLYLSSIFRRSFNNLSRIKLELYDTTGAEGAARGAGLGIGYFKNTQQAFTGLERLQSYLPQDDPELQEAYLKWKRELHRIIN